MDTQLSTQLIWNELHKQIFGVLGMVTARGVARTVGVVYVVDGGRLYVATGRSSWKARHIAANPQVSLTVPIHKRIPLLPWIKIPAATISFGGAAALHGPDDLPPALLASLYRGTLADPAVRDRNRARGRTPVGVVQRAGGGQ